MKILITEDQYNRILKEDSKYGIHADLLLTDILNELQKKYPDILSVTMEENSKTRKVSLYPPYKFKPEWLIKLKMNSDFQNFLYMDEEGDKVKDDIGNIIANVISQFDYWNECEFYFSF